MLENINNFRIVVKKFIYLMNLTYILSFFKDFTRLNKT